MARWIQTQRKPVGYESVALPVACNIYMFRWKTWFLALIVSGTTAVATMQPIVPAGDWRAVDGSTIEAHEGGIIQVGGTYYLYGTDRSQNNGWFLGINLYSSTDLVHWAFVRQILNNNSHSALQNRRVERPKMLRNPSTGEFVLWWHHENDSYSLAEVAYAVSPTIEGDFVFQDHFRPMGRDSRDMGAFQDTDGKAYLICSTDGNSSGTIFRLNSSYTGVEAEVFHGGGSVNGEGHSMLKVGNIYFWFVSGYSGWAANDNYYFTATSPSGPWTYRGAFVPSGSKTYYSQSYNVAAIQGNSTTTYIYMGDRWNPSALSKSRVVWLPLEISGTSAWTWWSDTWFVDTWTGYWGYGPQNIPDGTYKILARHSGKALHASGTTDVSPVVQTTFTGNSNQLWNVTWLNDNGSYRITGVGSGRVLEVNGNSTSDGAAAEIYSSNGGNNQKWMITPTDRGYYSVLAQHSGKILEVPGSANTNGAPVDQWTRLGGNHQEWAFVRVDNNNKPPAPENLKAVIPNGVLGKVRLDWTPVNGAGGYRIKRANTNTGPFLFVGVSSVPSFTLGPATDAYYYSVSATNWFGEGSNSVPLRFASTGLRARYECEGGFTDSTSNAYDGINSSATFNLGKIGNQSAQFDGTNHHATIPCPIGQNDFTIAFWMKTTDTGGEGQWWAGRGLVDGETAGNAPDFGTALVGNKVAFGIGSPDTTLLSMTSVNDGNWHHVAATWNRTNGDMQLYVDGILDNTVTGPIGARTAPPALRLGSIQTGASGGFFQGSLDDVRLCEYIMSASEVALLANPNTAPTLAALPDQTMIAGATLSVTNSAGDAELPPQTLTFSLLNPPAGASINTSNGVLVWRPTIAQSPSTNLMTVRVADDGSPSLSATQSFWTTVLRPVEPVLSTVAHSNGVCHFSVTGDAGPDYTVLCSSNLVDWTTLLATNPPAVPFFFSDPVQATVARRFYRVILGP